MQARVQSLTASADAAEALRQENTLLKKQLASFQSTPLMTPENSDMSVQLRRAQAQISQLQAEAQAVWGERQALQNRVQELTVAVSLATTNQLQSERISGNWKKNATICWPSWVKANKKLYGGKQQNAAAQIDALAQQVETLRARIAVDEAQPVPYTPEELALLKEPAPTLAANPDAEKKSSKELPGGVMKLVAEAQSSFRRAAIRRGGG